MKSMWAEVEVVVDSVGDKPFDSFAAAAVAKDEMCGYR
jgi:hypothetical protein